MGWVSRVEQGKPIIPGPSSSFVFPCLYTTPNHCIQNTPLSSLLLLPSLNKPLNMQTSKPKQKTGQKLWGLSLVPSYSWILKHFWKKNSSKLWKCWNHHRTLTCNHYRISFHKFFFIITIILHVSHTLTSPSVKHFCCRCGLNGPCKEGRCTCTGHPQSSKSEGNNMLRTNYHQLFYQLYYQGYRKHSPHNIFYCQHLWTALLRTS